MWLSKSDSFISAHIHNSSYTVIIQWFTLRLSYSRQPLLKAHLITGQAIAHRQPVTGNFVFFNKHRNWRSPVGYFPETILYLWLVHGIKIKSALAALTLRYPRAPASQRKALACIPGFWNVFGMSWGWSAELIWGTLSRVGEGSVRRRWDDWGTIPILQLTLAPQLVLCHPSRHTHTSKQTSQTSIHPTVW